MPWCRRCGKLFVKTGKYQRMCDECRYLRIHALKPNNRKKEQQLLTKQEKSIHSALFKQKHTTEKEVKPK